MKDDVNYVITKHENGLKLKLDIRDYYLTFASYVENNFRKQIEHSRDSEGDSNIAKNFKHKIDISHTSENIILIVEKAIDDMSDADFEDYFNMFICQEIERAKREFVKVIKNHMEIKIDASPLYKVIEEYFVISPRILDNKFWFTLFSKVFDHMDAYRMIHVDKVNFSNSIFVRMSSHEHFVQRLYEQKDVNIATLMCDLIEEMYSIKPIKVKYSDCNVKVIELKLSILSIIA